MTQMSERRTDQRIDRSRGSHNRDDAPDDKDKKDYVLCCGETLRNGCEKGLRR